MNRVWIFLLCFSLVLSTCMDSGCKKTAGTILPPDTDTTSKDSSVATIFDSIPVIVWIEAAANFSRLATASRMDTVFSRLSKMGAKAIVLDVKGVSGLVSYQSAIATQLKAWNGATQATDFDYLGNAIVEAKKYGLKVFASLSVFTEGMNYYGEKFGKVFTDTSFAAIQSQVMTSSGSVKNITDVYTYGFLNPIQPKAQSYELSLIKEIVSNYNIDGLILDYCRYYDITADFSDYSLQQFKKWANLSSVTASDIVSSWTSASDGTLTPASTGSLYSKWLEFRSQSIHDFVSDVRSEVKGLKPNLPLGAYAGAWYDSYYTVGVNWASDTYNPYANGYSWATSTYKNTGYAELLDVFMMGNYTPTVTGSGWWTVQGELAGAKTVLNGANSCYGGIDIGNTQWASLDNMNSAIEMIIEKTKGIMLFDLSHIDDPTNNQFSEQLYDDLSSAIKAGEAAK